MPKLSKKYKKSELEALCVQLSEAMIEKEKIIKRIKKEKANTAQTVYALRRKVARYELKWFNRLVFFLKDLTNPQGRVL